jgi:preprotein translocase subunit SecD
VKLAATVAVLLVAHPAATFVLRAVPPPGHALTPADVRRSVEVMRDRAAALGPGHAEIRRVGNDRVVIRLDGAADPRAAAATIAQTGRLEIYDLEPSLLRALPTRPRKLPAGTVVVTCSRATAVVCPTPSGGAEPARGQTFRYLFRHRPALTTEHVERGSARRSTDPATGVPIVTVALTSEGNRAFEALTRKVAVRGSHTGAAQHVAIVLDGALRAFPAIDYTRYPNGIDASAGMQLGGVPSAAEAKRLAVVLRTGELPVRFVAVR